MASRRILPLRFGPLNTEIACTVSLCLSCILFLPAMVHAQAPNNPGKRSYPQQYVARAWRTEQGLPQNSVNAIVQDREGYIWIGTFGGLARFDGEHLKIFSPADTPGFTSARILSLHQSRAGDLWIGTVDGGLTRLRDGTAVTYTERDGLPSQFIRSISEDAGGNIWINTARGIARFAGAKLAAYIAYHEQPVSEFYLQARDGAMWFRSGQEVVRFGVDGSTARLPTRHPIGLRLVEARDGSVWIASPEQYRLVRYSGGVFTDIALPPPGQKVTGQFPLLAIAQDVGENPILLTPSGLVHVSEGKLGLPQPVPAPNPDGDIIKARNLLVDREGNFWAGTIASGLVRFRPAPLSAYGQKEGLSDASFSAVFQDRQDRIWLGGDQLYWWDGHEFHLVPGVANLRTIAQTRDGDLWFGGYGGLHRWRAGVLTHFPIEARAVRAIYQDREGTLWVGALMEDAPGGLYRLQNGHFEQIPDITDVRSIDEDRTGGLWVGGLQGLWYVRDGRTVLYDEKQGLSNNAVYDIYQDSNEDLWVATYGGGLNRFRRGHFRAITSKEGLPNNMLVQLIDDGHGNLWVSSNQDIFRFTISQLNDFLDGRISSISPVSYGIAEGMRSSECNQGSPAALRTPDGRLWFPTLRGVVAIDPMAGAHFPPPVLIEEARANKWNLASDRVTSVQPGNNTLDFRFTALSFSAPEEVRFKYRLEPFDTDWVDSGTRRTAHYTNMPAGDYLFRVVAANSYGVWNEQGAGVHFILRPHYYQTHWFLALCAVVFVGLLWAAYQLRLRQLQHQFEMTLDARVDERTRIAREIHDTLLQSFHGLLLRFQTVSQLLPSHPVDAKKQLDIAIQNTADAVTEGRDAVQGLRDSTIQNNDLALAISTLGEELAAITAERPVFRVAVEGESRDLHPIVRDEIYKIAAEALRNAFRHAQAGQIEVEIRYDAEQFRLRVRDDGKGIDQAILSTKGGEGHFGLHGIRERAKLIGAQLTVWSEVHEGTEVELTMPATAYGNTPKGSWFSRKLLTRASKGL